MEETTDAAPRLDSSSPPSSPAPWSVRIHDKRAKAFRFTTVTDLALLREVVAHKPWASTHGDMAKTWETVATAFKQHVPWSTNDGRACKRRYLALAEAYATGKLHKLRGSGTPDMNAERETLLAQCKALTDEDHYRRKAQKEDRRPPVAQLALEDAARLASNGNSEFSGFETAETNRSPEASAAAAAGQDLTLVLNDPRMLLRQRELELDERKMKLEERRVKLEEQTFEQQRQTAEKQLEMMAAQTNVLLKLAEKLMNLPPSQ